MKVEGLNILITGSAVRVGKVMALTLARQGANIAVHYNTSESEALQTKSELEAIGVNTLLVKADMGKVRDIEKMAEIILGKWGYVDVLINNAAIFYKTPFWESTEEQFDDFINVNLKGPYFASKLFGKVMTERRKGKIINIADAGVKRPWPNYLPYTIAKAGMVTLTQGLAKALAPYVTVNGIAPGTVATAENSDPGMERSLIEKTPLRRIGSTIDIANTALYIIEGSDFINGEVIAVDGGRSLV